MLPRSAVGTLELSAVTIALTGELAYGGGDFIGGRAALRLSPAGAGAVAQVAAMALLGGALVRAGGFGRAKAVAVPVGAAPVPTALAWLRPPRVSVMAMPVALAALAGICDALGHMAYVHVATRGSMAVASALVALFPGVVVLLAVTLLREPLARLQVLGLAVGGTGIVVLSL